MKNWIEFWNSDNPIYVNARHKALHYRLIARDISALVPDSDSIVLDFGCGEAIAAEDVSRHCRKLCLFDAAPTVRAKLSEQFAHIPHIEVLAPEDHAPWPEAGFDLIILHSVAQYIEKGEFAALIRHLAAQLRDGGRIVVGDILPRDLSAITDVRALLSFGWEGGFFIAAISGLIRAALSDYRKIRGELGLTQYDEAEMLVTLEKAGLTTRRLEHNPGHNQARMAFMGLKVAPLE